MGHLYEGKYTDRALVCFVSKFFHICLYQYQNFRCFASLLNNFTGQSIICISENNLVILFTLSIHVYHGSLNKRYTCS